MFRLLTLVFLFGGCVRYSDTTQADSETYARLLDWAQGLETAHAAGLDVTKYKSASDAWKHLSMSGIVDGAFLPNLKEDHWGRPFHLEIKKQKLETVIQIRSDGRDGIDQNGLGDDLYINIHLLPDGKAKRSVRPKEDK